jgi:hypothetical protein
MCFRNGILYYIETFFFIFSATPIRKNGFLVCYDNLMKSMNFGSVKYFSFRSATRPICDILERMYLLFSNGETHYQSDHFLVEEGGREFEWTK